MKTKHKIYGERVKNGKVVEQNMIGIITFDETISARKYNMFKRTMRELFTNVNKGEYVRMTDDLGRVANFGGYPAETFVKFILDK